MLGQLLRETWESNEEIVENVPKPGYRNSSSPRKSLSMKVPANFYIVLNID